MRRKINPRKTFDEENQPLKIREGSMGGRGARGKAGSAVFGVFSCFLGVFPAPTRLLFLLIPPPRPRPNPRPAGSSPVAKVLGFPHWGLICKRGGWSVNSLCINTLYFCKKKPKKRQINVVSLPWMESGQGAGVLWVLGLPPALLWGNKGGAKSRVWGIALCSGEWGCPLPVLRLDKKPCIPITIPAPQ